MGMQLDLLYGHAASSLISLMSREKQTEDMREWVLGKIFGPKNEEMTGGNCIMRSFLIFTAHQIFK
jgi:hypothetical protein